LGVVSAFGAAGPGVGRVASVGADSVVTTGPFGAEAGRAVDEFAAAREGVADTVGQGADRINAGDSLMSGADNFLRLHIKGGARGPNSKPITEILLDRVSKKIPTSTTIDASHASAALNGFLNQFPNLKNASKDLGVAKWQAWIDDIDAAGGKLKWSEVRALRTMIGESIGKLSGPLGDRSSKQLNQLYGALSKDLKTAAEAAGAGAEWTRYNTHFSKAAGMVDDALDVIFGAKSPEAAYERLLALGKDKGQGANVRKLAEIRRAMPAENWQQVVSTVIRRMGTRGDDTFSPATFVTEWGKLSKEARNVLFTGRKVPKGLAQAMDDLVRVAERSKGAEKLLNHSNSGANMINAASGVGVAGSLISMDVIPIALAAAGIGAARIGAEAMTSPVFLRALRTYIASGGGKSAGKRLTQVLADNPELLAMPVSGARHGPNSEAPPRPQPAAIRP